MNRFRNIFTTSPLKTQTWLFPWGLIAAFILFVATFLRFSHLGTLPQGMTWDEAFLGYVGKMVITTGRDEHEDFLPIVFRSFGDYKAPLGVYLTGVSTSLFGLTPLATRLPYALAGVLTVGLVGGITWLRTRSWGWSLLAAWILAILPWHVHFSRLAFESGLAVFFFALFLMSWQALRQTAVVALKTKILWWSLLLTGVLGSIYVYHSSKIVLPLSILTIGIWEVFTAWPMWRARWREIFSAGVIGIMGLGPFFWSLQTGGLNRASQTLFWHHLHTQESWISRLAENILAHMSWDFLVLGAADTLRHGTGYAGVLTATQLIALILGATWLLWKHFTKNSQTDLPTSQTSRWAFWRKASAPELAADGIILWSLLTIIAFIPAIIGFEVPHPNRALLAVVPLTILATEGVKRLQATLQGNARQTLLATLILFTALESAAFWHDLTTEYPARSSAAWMEGRVEMSRWAGETAQNGTSVAITRDLGEPEIFFGFANDWPIERYRARDFGGVIFVDQDQLTNQNAARLVSSQPLTEPDLTLLTEIKRRDGLTQYWIYARE